MLSIFNKGHTVFLSQCLPQPNEFTCDGTDLITQWAAVIAQNSEITDAPHM